MTGDRIRERGRHEIDGLERLQRRLLILQMAVWTVLPCQAMSRGWPTLTESKRPITFPNDDHAIGGEPGKIPPVASSGAANGFVLPISHSSRFMPP
jgi:hypothetical protein